MGMWPHPPEELRALPREPLSRISRVKPRVWRVRDGEGSLILKDSAGLPWPGILWGRLVLRREHRALRRLAGLAFVPRVLARPDRDALGVEAMEGRPLERDLFRAGGRDTADRLMASVRAMHERGVFHLDLRHRQNILITDHGMPVLVDFGAAVVPGRLGRALWGWLLRWVDEMAVIKYIARFRPDLLTETEARRLVRGAVWRRLWVFSPYTARRDVIRARERLAELARSRGDS